VTPLCPAPAAGPCLPAAPETAPRHSAAGCLLLTAPAPGPAHTGTGGQSTTARDGRPLQLRSCLLHRRFPAALVHDRTLWTWVMQNSRCNRRSLWLLLAALLNPVACCMLEFWPITLVIYLPHEQRWSLHGKHTPTCWLQRATCSTCWMSDAASASVTSAAPAAL
jgi:hypothetical protein